MVGKFAPNSPHLTRGLVKYVPTSGCKSDSEILVSLETVETVVRTQKHRLEADKFPIFSVGGPGKDFIAIWIPVGLSSGLSSWFDPLTFVALCDHGRDWHLVGL